jgi:hypothetical protein
MKRRRPQPPYSAEAYRRDAAACGMTALTLIPQAIINPNLRDLCSQWAAHAAHAARMARLTGRKAAARRAAWYAEIS